jgi:hypothetical protein
MHNFTVANGREQLHVSATKQQSSDCIRSIKIKLYTCVGRDSDSLRAGRSTDRILVGARFSTPVQASPGTHPGPYTKALGLSRGLSAQGVEMTTHTHLQPRLNRVELHIYSLSGYSWPFLGWTLPLSLRTCCLHIVTNDQWTRYQPYIKVHMIAHGKAFTRYSTTMLYSFKNETSGLVVVGTLCGWSKCWGGKLIQCVFLYEQ